jgi:hypothetical protein
VLWRVNEKLRAAPPRPRTLALLVVLALLAPAARASDEQAADRAEAAARRAEAAADRSEAAAARVERAVERLERILDALARKDAAHGAR